MLTRKEMEDIAQLRVEPGYTLILDALQAQVDDIGSELDKENSPKRELRLLSLWKAFRRILAILRNYPALIAQELHHPETYADPVEESITDYLPRGFNPPPPFPPPFTGLFDEENDSNPV